MRFFESIKSLWGSEGSLSQSRPNLKKFKRFRNRYQGQRCFVMGNGPSLNQTPLEKLKNEVVWGVNRCHLLYDRIDWRPKFYCAVDHRVTPSISPEIDAQTLELTDTTFFMPEQYAGLRDWKDRENIVWTREKLQDPSLGADGYFATNPPDFLRTPNTVTITCIQLAVFMGFNPIYLIGTDAKWVMPEGLAKGEGQVRDPGTGELVTNFALTMESESDPNHFHPDYFKKGDPWTAPNLGGQLYGYNRVREKCEGLGVEIINATVGGELEAFPRGVFGSLF